MKRKQPDKHARIYPCADCGIMRSKAEGGAIFTVCDSCWKIHYDKKLGRITQPLAGRSALQREGE
jgi:hypothetical protein